MDYRELLPYGIQRFGVAAADGQMASIMKLYLDWRLSGDTEWLRQFWPAAKRALEFAWIQGGWDANRDGVMEGVQHNTYDVEFIGPNPLCGIWYLGGLRAGEEMARVVGDRGSADEYHQLFRKGSAWIDAKLFNGEFYIQKIGSIPRDAVAKGLIEGMGSGSTEDPTFQLGDGCLVDQLVGQYFAQIAGLGLLLDPAHVQNTLQSIYKYNYKRTLKNHVCVMRTFALNEEAALVICDYPHGKPPKTPFPYFEEVMAGFEYSAAILMLCMGMVSKGVELIANIRRRYDGKKRNPWNEAEYGYYYARPMASWAALVALSEFSYNGGERKVTAAPRIQPEDFSSFWSCGTAWGTSSQHIAKDTASFSLSVVEGELACRSVELRARGKGKFRSSAMLGSKLIPHKLQWSAREQLFIFPSGIIMKAGQDLNLKLSIVAG
jgi:non-lysosomal glucosylceramidase